MSLQVVTKKDLTDLKTEILLEFRKIMGKPQFPRVTQLLRSSEVKELLNISSGTLKSFRKNGAISFRKIGGTFFYPNDEIQKLIQTDKN